MHIVAYLSNLFELLFETPTIVLLWRDRCFAWTWWIRFWISWNERNQHFSINDASLALSDTWYLNIIQSEGTLIASRKCDVNLPSFELGTFGVMNGKPFDCVVLVTAALWGIENGVVCCASECSGKSGSIRPTCIFNFSNTSVCWRFCRFCKLGMNIFNGWFGPNGEFWL